MATILKPYYKKREDEGRDVKNHKKLRDTLIDDPKGEQLVLHSIVLTRPKLNLVTQ